MSALTKIEFERDTNCIEISLFAQCRALINEGMANEIVNARADPWVKLSS